MMKPGVDHSKYSFGSYATLVEDLLSGERDPAALDKPDARPRAFLQSRFR